MRSSYGLIGKKLSHSFSVPIHNMLGNNDYTLNELAPEELEEFIKGKQFKGINVTIPYKTDVIPWLDEISDKAKRIGSVNTIVNKNGRLCGDNTDYFGFSYMAKNAGISFKDKKVIIFGTGGTSLTARTVAADEGAKELIIVGRSSKNNYDNLYLHYDADIIVNTTPVGMYPHVEASITDLNNFKRLSGVIDVIYNPLRTDLLLQAEEKNIPCTNGLPMLVAQAKPAHELFLDTKVEDRLIEYITKAFEAQNRNIVLIGMPGCGKTTLGNALANTLSRDMIDTDQMIIDNEGFPIPQIFEKYGEKYFRDCESRCVKQASAENSKIIATGGGAILREENRKALRRNSVVIWLKRDIDTLSTDGRPLSKDINALKEMQATRYPIYEITSDAVVEITSDITENINKILEIVKGL